MIEHSVEFQSYIPGLKEKSIEYVSEMLASYSLETKRVPDPYNFLISSEGKLISPINGQAITEVVNTDSYLGQAELLALKRVEGLVKEEQDGIIVWISPHYRGVYNDVKVIVSEIIGQGKNRVLFNRAIILDINEADGLEFARGLSRYSKDKVEFSDLEQVRVTPLHIASLNLHWSYLLEELTETDQFRMIRGGSDIKAKEQALTQAEILIPKLLKGQDITSTGLVGESRGSCPVFKSSKTAFMYVFDGELGCREIECKKCGWKPDALDLKKMEQGELDSCPAKKDGKKCGWKPGEPV